MLYYEDEKDFHLIKERYFLIHANVFLNQYCMGHILYYML